MRHVVRYLTAGALVLGAACNDAAPDVVTPVPPASLTHPAGTVVATTPLGGRPFGLAVHRESGTVLITQLDVGTVTAGSLPSPALDRPITVGNVPTNAAFGGSTSAAFVTNQVDRTIGFLSVAGGTQVGTVAVPMPTFNVGWSRYNKRLYVTGPGTHLYIINPATARLVDSIPTQAVTNGITMLPDGRRIYVSDETNRRVLDIDAALGRVVRTFATGGAPKGLAVTPDARRLYVADETGAVQVWNLSTGRRLATIALPGGAFGIAVSPDGAQVLAGMPFRGSVAVIATASNTVAGFITTGGVPRRIGYSPDGATALIANESGWVDYVQ